jgi:hypothetical protein
MGTTSTSREVSRLALGMMEHDSIVVRGPLVNASLGIRPHHVVIIGNTHIICLCVYAYHIWQKAMHSLNRHGQSLCTTGHERIPKQSEESVEQSLYLETEVDFGVEGWPMSLMAPLNSILQPLLRDATNNDDDLALTSLISEHLCSFGPQETKRIECPKSIY